MSDPIVVKASGQLVAADLYRYSIVALLKRFRFFAIIMALVAVYAIVAPFLNNVAPFEWNAQSILGLAFPFVLAPYVFFLAPYLSAKKQVKTNPNLSGVISYSFTDSGFEMTGPHVQSQIAWKALLEVAETRTQFLLYSSKFVAHVIPKRFLAGPGNVAALRGILRANVPKASLPK